MPPKKQHPTMQTPPDTTTTVTKCFFPANVCQILVNGKPEASNACTIISSLWCRQFLLHQLEVPLNKKEIRATAESYKQTITNGNFLYQGMNLPPNQPNLEVRDVVSRINDLKLYILQDLGFFTVDDIKNTFRELSNKGERHAGVLIISPANSVAVLMDAGHVAIFDSHQHGSLVYTCKVEQINKLLDQMNGNNQNLCGSNFAELAMYD